MCVWVFTDDIFKGYNKYSFLHRFADLLFELPGTV